MPQIIDATAIPCFAPWAYAGGGGGCHPACICCCPWNWPEPIPPDGAPTFAGGTGCDWNWPEPNPPEGCCQPPAGGGGGAKIVGGGSSALAGRSLNSRVPAWVQKAIQSSPQVR